MRFYIDMGYKIREIRKMNIKYYPLVFSGQFQISGIAHNLYREKSFLGCFVARMFRCFATVTCVYISVMLIELCPNISWI